MAEKTLYEYLEVSEQASPETIRAAYKSLMQRCHPDKNQGDSYVAEQAKLINRAYQILSDPMRRAAYDAELESERREQHRPSSAGRESQKRDSPPEQPSQQPESQPRQPAAAAPGSEAKPQPRSPGSTVSPISDRVITAGFWLCTISVVIAFFDVPYVFYRVLHVLLFALCSYILIKRLCPGKLSVIFFGTNVLLYNPIFPIQLGAGTKWLWILLNLVLLAAVFWVWSEVTSKAAPRWSADDRTPRERRTANREQYKQEIEEHIQKLLHEIHFLEMRLDKFRYPRAILALALCAGTGWIAGNFVPLSNYAVHAALAFVGFVVGVPVFIGVGRRARNRRIYSQIYGFQNRIKELRATPTSSWEVIGIGITYVFIAVGVFSYFLLAQPKQFEVVDWSHVVIAALGIALIIAGASSVTSWIYGRLKLVSGTGYGEYLQSSNRAFFVTAVPLGVVMAFIVLNVNQDYWSKRNGEIASVHHQVVQKSSSPASSFKNERQRPNDLITFIEQLSPELNPDSPAYNQQAVNFVLARQAQYMRSGMPSSEALYAAYADYLLPGGASRE